MNCELEEGPTENDCSRDGGQNSQKLLQKQAISTSKNEPWLTQSAHLEAYKQSSSMDRCRVFPRKAVLTLPLRLVCPQEKHKQQFSGVECNGAEQ